MLNESILINWCSIWAIGVKSVYEGCDKSYSLMLLLFCHAMPHSPLHLHIVVAPTLGQLLGLTDGGGQRRRQVHDLPHVAQGVQEGLQLVVVRLDLVDGNDVLRDLGAALQTLLQIIDRHFGFPPKMLLPSAESELAERTRACRRARTSGQSP
jgi:hypothetical protein